MNRLLVLGTGNAVATKCYNTCFALDNGNEYFLVDSGGGNGILARLDEMQIDITKIHHIFVTHEHTDHILGIVWLIRIAAAKMYQEAYQGNLNIYCHPGLTDTIRTLCRLTVQGKFYKMVDSRILLIPVEDGETRQILDWPVTFFDIGSTKARQFGFTTLLENGTKLTCTGDEPYNAICEPYVKDSGWLLHEAFCLFSDRDIFKPYEKNHSTVKDACMLAEEMEIDNLILWHTEDKKLSVRKELYMLEGREYYNGNLYIPEDKEIISLD